jgi:adenosylcobinamide-GDP ribazoletransferase
MDSCDGLLPPRDPARRLEIMKDSRVGAFGVVGGVLLLLIKYNALAALPGAHRLSLLVVVPVLARWAITWVMARYPLARAEGVSVFFRAGLGRVQLAVASATTVAVTLVVLNWPGLALWAIAWLVASLVAALAMARINGLTGDVYGAVGEITETGLLIAAVAAGQAGLLGAVS